jgi:hypothetical protein
MRILLRKAGWFDPAYDSQEDLSDPDCCSNSTYIAYVLHVRWRYRTRHA